MSLSVSRRKICNIHLLTAPFAFIAKNYEYIPGHYFKIAVLWDVVSSNLLDIQIFVGTSGRHFKVRRMNLQSNLAFLILSF
jgi:hypothetical protein